MLVNFTFREKNGTKNNTKNNSFQAIIFKFLKYNIIN